MITLENINKSFTNNQGEVQDVLSNFSLKISKSRFYTIIGPNGCGKSTLLNIIAGVIQPDSGKLKSSSNALSNIGYVWQDYRASLFPWLSVGENITFPLKVKGLSKSKRKNMALEVLNGFNSNLQPDQKVYELSGGQQQLVNLLRNMVIKPKLLLLDEPFSALDQSNRWLMAFRIEHVWAELNVPVLFVSHDIDEAVLLADEVLLINKTGQLAKRIQNDLPHPRNIEMLYSKRHVNYRKEIIEFLFEQGSIINGVLI